MSTSDPRGPGRGPGNGWIHWMHTPPPGGRLLQVMRDDWTEPVLQFKGSIHPLTNINGLYWRFTGIARMQEDGER